VGQGNEDELMDQDTQLKLIEMGIASPVTKESAGECWSTLAVVELDLRLWSRSLSTEQLSEP
jgi:hypothetical protein